LTDAFSVSILLTLLLLPFTLSQKILLFNDLLILWKLIVSIFTQERRKSHPNPLGHLALQ
jgi:hypothetical protein